MNDFLKDATLALVGVVVVNGLLQRHAERALLRDLRKHVAGGSLSVKVSNGGTIGLLGGVAASATIEGQGTTLQRMPYTLRDGGGIRSEIQRLSIRLKDATFKRVRVDLFAATVPSVKFDGGAVLIDSRVILRTAGEGTAEATIGPGSLAEFLEGRVPGLRVERVELLGGRASFEGVLTLLGKQARIRASGAAAVEEGRRIGLVNPILLLNGEEPPPAVRQLALGLFDPILDVDRDLGLGDTIYLTSVAIEDGWIRVRGRFQVPVSLREFRRGL